MPSSLKDQLKSALKDLMDMNPQIIFAGLVRSDGLALAATYAEEINTELISATVAGVFHMAKNSVNQLRNTTIENVMITGDKNIMIINHVYDSIILAVVAKKNANLGYTFLTIKNAKKKIEKILEK